MGSAMPSHGGAGLSKKEKVSRTHVLRVDTVRCDPSLPTVMTVTPRTVTVSLRSLTATLSTILSTNVSLVS